MLARNTQVNLTGIKSGYRKVLRHSTSLSSSGRWLLALLVLLHKGRTSPFCQEILEMRPHCPDYRRCSRYYLSIDNLRHLFCGFSGERRLKVALAKEVRKEYGSTKRIPAEEYPYNKSCHNCYFSICDHSHCRIIICSDPGLNTLRVGRRLGWST